MPDDRVGWGDRPWKKRPLEEPPVTIAEPTLPRGVITGEEPPEVPPVTAVAEPPEEELMLPPIPPEGIPFPVTTAEGEPLDLTLKPDYTLWEGDKQVGSYDSQTGVLTPKEPSFWGKVGATILPPLAKGLEIAFAPATITGMGVRGLFIQTSPTGHLSKEDATAYGEELAALREKHEYSYYRSLPRINEEEYWRQEALLRERYEVPTQAELERRATTEHKEQPWWQQLLWELPFWAALGVSGVSAIKARAAAQALPAALRVPARVALAPVAGYERVIGFALSQTIGRVRSGVFVKLTAAATRRQLRLTAQRLGIKLTKETEVALYAAYRKAFSAHLDTELRAWATLRGVKIPIATEGKLISYLTTHASPKWAAGQMLAALGKAPVTPTMIGTAADATAKSAVAIVPKLLDDWVKPPTAVTKPPIVPPVTPKVPITPPVVSEALVTPTVEPTVAPPAPRVTPPTPKVTKPLVEPTITPVIERPAVVSEVAGLENRRVEIKELLTRPAKELPEGVTKVALRREFSEVSAGLVPAEKHLRQTIMAVVKTKGLPQSQYRKIFLAQGGSRQLSSVTYTGLNKVLDAVRVARPVKIGVKNVLKLQTERNIQTLKDILIAEKKMTPEIYETIKKDLKLKTDRFESKEMFITESEAGSLIRQMNYEAEVGISEWDTNVAEALSSQPQIKAVIDRLSNSIVQANKATLRGKTSINWGKFALEISEVPSDVGLSGTMSIMRALRRFQEQLGGREATRIYDVAEMMIETRRLNDLRLAQRISQLKAEVPELPRVIKNKESMTRIQQWLDADLKVVKIEKPVLTPEELKVAQLFRAEYDQWKDVVRLERFKDAYYRYKGKPELIKDGTDAVAIPDAPLADIKEAIKIYESGGETALANYLKTKTWGVVESGYSFSQVIHPQLRLGKRYAVRATTTSLHQRQGLDFLRDERTPWERLVSYERQMIGLNLQPYFRKMDREFNRIVEQGRLHNPRRDANTISLFLREVKGFPVESPVVRVLLRIGGWSFGTLAKVPWMSVRNLHQNIAFHPDKSEIGKALFTGGFYANPLTRNGRLDYTNTLVHQYKGVIQEQLLMGYMGKTPLENLMRKTDYYHLSDKLNRTASMAGSGAKADRALKAYLKDGDAEKFLRNSGANELSQTEQLRILEYLSLRNYDYGGVLDSVSGGEAAIRDIAARITTLNHFNYIRFLRSSVEMGEVGRVLGSLVAFPRSIAEKYVDLFSKLRPSRGLTGSDRKRAIHSLLALVIGSVIASAMLNALTGKKRDAYNPLLVLQWQIGGLAVGATENLTEVYRQLSNLAFAKEEEGKDYALKELAILIPGLGDSFIPFYGSTMNFIESLADSRYIDREAARKVRAMFDESYKPSEEFYNIERTLLEKIQHALFGTNTPDPTDIEQALRELSGMETNLGQIDEEALDKAKQKSFEAGKAFSYNPKDFIYTTSSLGSDINSALYGIDPSEIIIENGFSQLTLAYLEYQAMFDDYKDSPADKRYEYREKNPVTDANLFFWGYVTTLQSETARSLVRQMMGIYNIPPEAIRGYESEFGYKPATAPAYTPTPPEEAPPEGRQGWADRPWR